MDQFVQIACKAIDDKGGEDIRILDLRTISPLADYFIIADADNERKVKAIADAVQDELAKEQLLPRSSEGYESQTWILLDYGDFIVHVFKKEERDFYNLERLWKDAQEIPYEKAPSA